MNRSLIGIWIAFCLSIWGSVAMSLNVADPALQAWGAYKTLLMQHPLATKSATAAILAGVSDAITQRVVEPSKQSAPKTFDFVRSAHIILTGYIWSGPSAHYWYQTLEQIVRALGVSQSPWTALLTRSFFDAIFFSPVTIAGYFTVRTLMEQVNSNSTSTPLQAVVQKLRAAWFPTLKGAWKFWPAVNLVSFWFFPVEYRVLYANVMSLLWTGFLSFMNQAQQRNKQRQATNPVPSAPSAMQRKGQ